MTFERTGVAVNSIIALGLSRAPAVSDKPVTKLCASSTIMIGRTSRMMLANDQLI